MRVIFFLILFLWGTSLFSQSGSDYIITRYTMDDGLPLNSTNNVFQSPDRHLWISTYNGLVRFDGHEFKLFNSTNTPAFRSNRIVDLIPSNNFPGFWMNLENGGAVYFDFEKFRYFGKDHGFTDRRVISILDHSDGTIYLGTDDGTFVYDGLRFIKVLHFEDAELNRAMYFLEDGSYIWMGTTRGVVRYDVTDGSARVFAPRGLDTHLYVNTVTMHPGGYPIMSTNLGIYVVRDDSLYRHPLYHEFAGTDLYRILRMDDDLYLPGPFGLSRERAGQLSHLTGENPLGFTNLTELMRTSDGQLLAYFSDGSVVRVLEDRDEYARFDIQIGLSSDAAHHITEDDEHNLWIATRYGGLLKLTPNPFSYIDTSDGLPGNNILSLLRDSKNNLWVSVRDRGVYRQSNGRFVPATTNPAMMPNITYGMAEDKYGTIWAGTYQNGIYKYHPNGSAEHLDLGFIAGHNTIFSIYRSTTDEMWVGTGDGLIQFKGNERTNYSTAQGLLHPHIRYIAEGADGSIWVATQGGGIARLDGHTGLFDTSWNREDLGLRAVRSLYIDHELDGIWVGSESHGLYFVSETVFGSIDMGNGLPDNSIHSIVDLGDGKLWMNTNRGIFYASKSDLFRAITEPGSRIDIVLFDKTSGMRNPEGNGGFQPNYSFEPSGRLWFPTQAGIAGLNLEALNYRDSKVTLRFRKLVAQDTELDLHGLSAVRLPVSARDFSIHFTGINFSAPSRIKFEYRLLGYDDQWYPAQTNRSAYFTNIPRGDYRFELRSTDTFGTLRLDRIGFDLTIPPLWYETVSFYTLAFLLLLLSVVGIVKLTTSRTERQNNRLRQLVEEKTDQYLQEKEAVEQQKLVIEAQAERLAELNSAKDRFIYLLGHDLRSPLQSVMGTLSILESEYLTLSREEQKELISIHKESFNRLSKLILNLLDWAQLDGGLVKVRMHTLDLVPILQNVIDLFHHEAVEKNITIKLVAPDHCEVRTDENMIQLAIRNLLSNAIKYSHPESSIEIICEKGGKRATLCIRDTGVGMTPEQIDNLFKIGSLSSTPGTNMERGTGLGLLLVSEVSRKLDLNLSIESAPDKGSVFKLVI